jgi:SAM-dependent methyltransferase
VEPYDAVVFTRSLHHIDPLDAALARAEELLAPGGRLLVEDFAVERMEAKPVSWFRDAARDFDERGLIEEGRECLGLRLLRQDDALERWKREHRDLLDAQTILAEIGRRFDLRHAEDGPYLFRFLAPALRANVGGFDALVRFVARETDAIADGHVTAIGRRYVALRR